MEKLEGARGSMQWHPTPVFLPGKSHGWRSLVGCSPWSREESDTTERLDFHFSLSCFGEGNGNLLQCSCLENPRDGGAWLAAVYGVAKSRTRLKWLSSSSRKQKGASQVALVVKNPPASAGDIKDTGSVPGLGRPPGGGDMWDRPSFPSSSFTVSSTSSFHAFVFSFIHIHWTFTAF